MICDLKNKNDMLYRILKKIQPFYNNNNDDIYNWLCIFNKINNKYKHRGFIFLHAKFSTFGGGWISMSPNMSCQRFTLKLQDEIGAVKEVTTDLRNDKNIEFQFCFENGTDLIPFLDKVIKGTYSIIKEIWYNGPKAEETQ